jgi:hypothetical protein
MRLLEGPEDFEQQGFSPDIKSYVGTLLVQHGITTPPSTLDFAYISEKMITDRDNNLGSDSLMFEAYWDEQRSNVTDMEKFIIDKTDSLIDQLTRIPFKNVDSDFLKAAKGTLKDSIK